VSEDKNRRAEITARIPSAEELDLIAIDPPAEWLADKGWGDLGPQRQPASVPQIEAQVKQAEREVK
jgi:hypothetical protein